MKAALKMAAFSILFEFLQNNYLVQKKYIWGII